MLLAFGYWYSHYHTLALDGMGICFYIAQRTESKPATGAEPQTTMSLLIYDVGAEPNRGFQQASVASCNGYSGFADWVL